MCEISKVVGPEGQPIRTALRSKAKAIVYGRIADDGSVEAHLARVPDPWIYHLDFWSMDTTAIRRRAFTEPKPEHSKLAANDLVSLRDEISTYLRSSPRINLRVKSSSFDLKNDLDRFSDIADPVTDEIAESFAMDAIEAGEASKAFEVLNSRIDQRPTPSLLRAKYHALMLVGPSDSDRDSESHRAEVVSVLRQLVAEYPDDPELGSDIHNLILALPDTNRIDPQPEADRLFAKLERDPTYQTAWWIKRLRGAREYGRAIHEQAFRDSDARATFQAAAGFYSKALWLRHRSKRLDPLGPTAPRFHFRSPVLHANAFDAHTNAGRRVRAVWHRTRAQIAMRFLFRAGVRAWNASDWLTAHTFLSQVLTVGWPNQMGTHSRVLASLAALRMGDAARSEALWEEALRLDEREANRLKLVLGPSGREGEDRQLESDEERPP